MFLLIFDSRPAFLEAADQEVSLLSLPVGAGTLASHLVEQVSALPGELESELTVVPGFAVDERYQQRLERAVGMTVRVVPSSGLPRVLAAHEPADLIVLIDAARWLAPPAELAALPSEGEEYRAATHFVAIGGDAEGGTREHIECDAQGCVERVQRVYDKANWPDSALGGILLSLVPALTLRNFNAENLAELRVQLAARGVLSRDVPVPGAVLNLAEAEGVLSLNEALLAQAGRLPLPRGWHAPAEGVIVGPACQVAASARLVGPVVLHERVTVAAEATVVGPCVIGAGSVVGGQATVAQCTLVPGTHVPAGAVLRQRVGCGMGTAQTQAPVQAENRSPAFDGMSFAQGGGEVAASIAPRRYRKLNLALKRGLDVSFSVAALLVLSPLMLLTALIVKLDSRGPVFFAHRREQRGGRDFPCLKFRTMTADAHQQQRALYQQNEVDGPQFNLRHDPRITRVGRWLRGTNIDELPQLINVLLGHMSLIGPRPSPFRENQICIPWRRARLSMRPGISGLWQVCRSEDRSEGDFHEWIYYDLAYIRNFSIWLDLKILLATVLTLGGRWSLPKSSLIPDDRGDPGHSGQALAT